MELDIIKLRTTWNDAAGSINSNYAKIADAIAQLKANGGGGGGGADIDLTDYATKVWVEAKGYITASALTPYALKTDIPSLVGYATEDFVNNKLNAYTTTEDLAENYASKNDLETAINNIDLSPYLKAEDAQDTYATQDYVTTKLVNYAPLTSVQGFENRIGGLEGAVPQLNARVETVESKVATLNEYVVTGENNLLDMVNAIEQEYATMTYVDNAIDGIDISAYLLKADLTKSRIQSTLGISDWALAATKPSYAWSEITSRPTALSQFTDDVVAGKYLPLSGGTINSTAVQPLYLKNNQSSCGILFFNSTDNATLMYSGGSNWRVTDNGWSNAYYLLHSGNIGNYKSGDSAKLDGYLPSSIYVGVRGYIKSGDDLSVLAPGGYWTGATVNSTNPLPTDYASLSVLGNDYYSSQLCVKHDATRAWIRGTYPTKKGVSNWHEVAFTDSNVASATKLQTPRTLWGQSFDGTDNISGAITLGGDLNNAAGGIYIHNTNEINSFNGKLYLNHRGRGLTGYGSTNDIVMVGNGGKVGIGNTSPTERLDVSGNIKASGNINATSITINGVTITASNGSITVNGNVFATGAITAKAVG